MATEGLISHIIISKYADALPLCRQIQIYARQGIALDRSTLANWVGRAANPSNPSITSNSIVAPSHGAFRVPRLLLKGADGMALTERRLCGYSSNALMLAPGIRFQVLQTGDSEHDVMAW